MADYKNTEKITFSREEEKQFRKLFNQWAASIKGYDRNKLGDEIKIVEVFDTPLYYAEIKTQYDSRWISKEMERLRGRSIPTTPKIGKDDINRWSMADSPTAFTNKENSFAIQNSHYVTTCHSCHGQGKVTCSECGGRGTVKRIIKTERNCPNCNGYGYVYEKRSRERQVAEYYTGQRKLVYKTEYYDEKVNCPVCQGRKKITESKETIENCRNCGATGKVTCSTCQGEGKVVNYLGFNQRLYTKTIHDYRFPILIQRDDASKIIKLFDKNTPWNLVENIRVEKGNFEQAGLKERPFVGAMLSHLAGSVEHPDSTAVCFSNVYTYECKAKTINYQIDGKQYTCMLLGDDWRLIAVTSPISDRLNDLRGEVNKYCRKRKYGKAWAVLQKVNKYPQAGSSEAYMQEELEKRMSMVTKFGTNLAIILCVLLVAPILYLLYETFGFFAPWTAWAIEEIDMTSDLTTAASLVTILWFSMRLPKSGLPKFSYQVASSTRRFIRGFIYGLYRALLCSAIVLLGTYTGAIFLLWGVVFACISTVFFIIFIIIGFISLLF